MPKQTKKDLKNLVDDLTYQVESLNKALLHREEEIVKRELEYRFLSDEYDEMLKHKNNIIKNFRFVAHKPT